MTSNQINYQKNQIEIAKLNEARRANLENERRQREEAGYKSRAQDLAEYQAKYNRFGNGKVGEYGKIATAILEDLGLYDDFQKVSKGIGNVVHNIGSSTAQAVKDIGTTTGTTVKGTKNIVKNGVMAEVEEIQQNPEKGEAIKRLFPNLYKWAEEIYYSQVNKNKKGDK